MGGGTAPPPIGTHPDPPFTNPPQTVTGLGTVGDTVAVRPGYARNFLVPSGAALGVRPTRADRAARVPRSSAAEASTPTPAPSTSDAAPVDEAALAAKRLASVARRLAAAVIEIPARGNKGGTLHTPVAAADVAAAVQDQVRVRLDARLVTLEEAIRQHGEYSVPLKLRLGGETVELTVRVGEPVREDGDAADAGDKAAAAPGGKGKQKK